MDIARLWCRWLKRTPNAELGEINPRLLIAKRVFPQFWRLRPEVRNHFLDNVQNRDDRRTLQTIELLCNASEVVQELSLGRHADAFRGFSIQTVSQATSRKTLKSISTIKDSVVGTRMTVALFRWPGRTPA